MDARLEQISPVIRQRLCGGWLAVSDAKAYLKIGATADTEDGARAAFSEALVRWDRILKLGQPKSEH